jgi:hypothetical protein
MLCYPAPVNVWSFMSKESYNKKCHILGIEFIKEIIKYGVRESPIRPQI